jgi:hypothetical protein
MKSRLILVAIAAVLLLSVMCAPIFAAPAPGGGVKARAAGVAKNGGLVDDPSLTPEAAKSWAAKTAAKEAEAGDAMQLPDAAVLGGDRVGKACLAATSKYGYEWLTASNYIQERSYWCGPASARQSLSWHKRHSGSTTTLPSQTTLANKIGTTTSGSSTSKIATALNSYDGVFGPINYVASNLTDCASPLSSFYTRIGWMLEDARTVPIILTETEFITRYRGHPSRHYMCVSGLDDRELPVVMRSVDSNPEPDFSGIQWDSVGCTAAAGLFKACYNADLNGANLVMCW